MTPKEKAVELLDIFYNIDSDSEIYDGFTMKIFYAQRCALICANKILDSIPLINNTTEQTIKRVYYINVIQEINKL
jgi:hypothetical protein